jgi:DNA adenine methylase
MELKPLVTYMGSKRRLIKDLRPYFETDFNFYVEPFCGGAAVFFGIDMKGRRAVINDLNKDLIESYKAVRDMDEDDYASLPKYRKIYRDVDELRNFVDKNINETGFKKYAAFSLKQSTTYNAKGTGKCYITGHYTQNNTVNNMHSHILSQYQQKLQSVEILNSDYIDVIKKYDNKDTLFYLDPPYENSKTMYKHEQMDFQELANILKKIDGKFILSLNSSPIINDLFSEFNIKKITTINKMQKDNRTRDEVIICNFNIK